MQQKIELVENIRLRPPGVTNPPGCLVNAQNVFILGCTHKIVIVEVMREELTIDQMLDVVINQDL
jgi:hypothetical protein